MDTARLSSKGQVTIPIGIRRRLGLRSGENVIFIEKSGDVLIASESILDVSTTEFSRFNDTTDVIFREPNNFHPKEKRRKILRSLYGSVDELIIAEPAETVYESSRDWGLMDR
jgi:AbrB family looped-hinge helix DNA binding protein